MPSFRFRSRRESATRRTQMRGSLRFQRVRQIIDLTARRQKRQRSENVVSAQTLDTAWAHLASSGAFGGSKTLWTRLRESQLGANGNSPATNAGCRAKRDTVGRGYWLACAA